MVYRVLGLMSGSSLDGLDIAFVEFQVTPGKWVYEIKSSACFPYSNEWIEKLSSATTLNALEYQLLHTAYGKYIGEQVNKFIQEKGIQYQVQLIASHGHTTFHVPAQKMTAQLGDGAAIAAATGINVVSDLRSIDIALSGQGAPIVPIGEKLLWPEYEWLLNIGGIANLSFKNAENPIAFDVCPANRVLNLLANEAGKNYDENGAMAASGKIHLDLLHKLNALDYYKQDYPKSLANDFGTQVVYKLIHDAGYFSNDALCTYVEHIVFQLTVAFEKIMSKSSRLPASNSRLLITGGGAHNIFLIKRLTEAIKQLTIEVTVPEKEVIDNKEAIVMALIGVLRWREENNVLASVTGASRNSIGGAVWIGQEA